MPLCAPHVGPATIVAATLEALADQVVKEEILASVAAWFRWANAYPQRFASANDEHSNPD